MSFSAAYRGPNARRHSTGGASGRPSGAKMSTP